MYKQLLTELVAKCRSWADLSDLSKIQGVDSLSLTGLAKVWGSALSQPLVIPPVEILTTEQFIALFVNHCQKPRLRPITVKPYENRVLKAREAAILRDQIKNHA